MNPHRFIDTRASGDSVEGSFPSATVNPPSVPRRDLAPFVHLEQLALRPDLADTARDRRMADHGVRQAEPDQGIRRRGTGQVGGQKRGGGPSVDVVCVPHPIRHVTDVIGRAQHGVDGAEGRLLQREADVDVRGPGACHVVADGGAGGWAEHQDDGAEPGCQGVAGHQVDDRLAPGSDGGQGFAAPVPTGSPRSQNDECGLRRLRGHAPQRRTALAHVMPPPNPVRSRLSPSCTRSLLMASWRARGMEADEVLP